MRTGLYTLTVVLAACLAAWWGELLTVRADDGASGPGTLSLESIEKMLSKEGAHQPYTPTPPLGISANLSKLIPEDNPLTPAKVALGGQLYFDPRLSSDETVSCASCHDPKLGWTDQAAVSTGIDGQRGGRSAPTVMNRVLSAAQFWDGRAASLEDQALGPIGNPIEMGFSAEKAAKRLNGIEGYRIQFERIFGGPATPDAIAKAIASFERTVLAGGSPYDHHEAALPYHRVEPDEDDSEEDRKRRELVLAGEAANPMSTSSLRGKELFFGKADCSTCHTGQNFSDELYYNIGVGFANPDGRDVDAGREMVSGDLKDRGAFRTPTLRNIADTAPYMHNGSQKTLIQVVEHYDRGGNPNPWQSDRIKKLGLTEQEKLDLVEFMQQGLQGQVTRYPVPRLP